MEEPDRTGFGTSVIDRGVPEETVKREFSPEGLIFSIEFPVKEGRVPPSSKQSAVA